MQTLQTERDAAAEEIDKQLQQINEVFSRSFNLRRVGCLHLINVSEPISAIFLSLPPSLKICVCVCVCVCLFVRVFVCACLPLSLSVHLFLSLFASSIFYYLSNYPSDHFFINLIYLS
jgi:hypothetical protein